MKNRKMLIIDDEKDFGFLMKCFFSTHQYDVTLAYTLAQGLEILEKESPDVIFLDNNLPDGLGWRHANAIITNHPMVQLNLISAITVPKTTSSTLHILQKPLGFDELLRVIQDKNGGVTH